MNGNPQEPASDEQQQYTTHPEDRGFIVAARPEAEMSHRTGPTTCRTTALSSGSAADDRPIAQLRTSWNVAAVGALILVYFLTGPFGDYEDSTAAAWAQTGAKCLLVLGLGILGDMALRPWDSSARRREPAYSEA